MPEAKETKENLARPKSPKGDIDGGQETRPPVVVILGHVDHGKSSLLEAIREDFVITSRESGGITQHIGAYEVEHQGRKITFIDTPGHEAFSAMRQRGARVADIAVLVVDAVEGVKAQTKEAIKFIKQAGVPMVVAFNKMDKPGAMPEKVKPQLAKEEVMVESYGGKVPSVNVSAKEKQGIEELLDTILLVAEVEELKADINVPAEGTVIESFLHAKKGPVATLLLKKGVLKEGDVLATPSTSGKAKNLSDFQGKALKEGLPSQPIQLLGFEVPPGVGERFKTFSTKEEALAFVEKKERKQDAKPVLDVGEGVKVLNIILKADVLGSCEAIEDILKALPQEKVILRVLKSEVGDITIGDIQLAESGKAKVFGFRVRMDERTKVFARQKGVKVKTFEVIYELVQEMRQEMLKVLAPETRRVDLAKFKITHIFKQNKENQIIGGRVMEGEITINVKAEIMREEEVIGEGRIKTLQKEKQTIGKAEKGQQIGMLLVSSIQVEEGDTLIIFREEKQKAGL